MRRALDEYIISGIKTNIPMQRRLLDDGEMVAGTMTTRTVERFQAEREAQRAKAR
jgi:acetyl-CoA carboxylase biotin carboxylase subunit